MEPILDCFDRWGTQHAGLFTFAHSRKHVGLYQKFGFWARFLTLILSKPIPSDPVEPAGGGFRWTGFSEAPGNERESLLLGCRQLTDTLYAGLDVGSEVRAVADQSLGETMLLWNDGRLVELAVCHSGPGTEVGSGAGYVKFGAVRQYPTARQDFDRLLNACEA